MVKLYLQNNFRLLNIFIVTFISKLVICFFIYSKSNRNDLFNGK